MADRAPGAEIRVGDQFEGVLDVVGRERLAVVPGHVVAKPDAPIQPVLGDPAIGLAGYLNREVRLDDA